MKPRCMFVLMMVAAATACTCPAQSAPPEGSAKAVFLFHLTQFVTWPEIEDDREFRVGILGPDPFGPVLEEVFQGETVGGRRIVVRRANTAASLADSDLVYVSPRARESMVRILRVFRGRAVLTVGEESGFLDTGGIVRFARAPTDKIRLEIDLNHAKASGLRISAQLLRVADVRGEPSAP